MNSEVILRVEDLSVNFGLNTVVNKVSFEIERGQTVALVGESGSGKTVSALSILRLLPYPWANHPSGSIMFKGKDLLKLPIDELRQIRGGQIAMIFQEPMTSLNPLHTVEEQISESLFLHKAMKKQQAHDRCLELLTLVGFKDPETKIHSYPHQLSGGQRQRVMIAMALAGDPQLLIADEPTTALDVTTQAQILELLKELQIKFNMALLLITHDLGIVKHVADQTYVMCNGVVRESGPTTKIFKTPTDSYTKALLAAEPKGSPKPISKDAPSLLEVEHITVGFPIRKGIFRKVIGEFCAVDDVSFSIREGETLGIVGESGSGKTTLAMALLRLQPCQGQIKLLGTDLHDLSARALRPHRREMQVVFQDPYGSLSPRMSISQIIGEGVKLHGLAQNKEELNHQVEVALQEVGLNPDVRDRYPHEFSGGQRQRIAIARALVLRPKLLVLDEPTSALDRAVQKEIIELLRGLQHTYKLAYIFISHDLKVVRAMSHRIYVMLNGKVVEQGDTETIFNRPQHLYTKNLLDAALDIKAR